MLSGVIEFRYALLPASCFPGGIGYRSGFKGE